MSEIVAEGVARPVPLGTVPVGADLAGDGRQFVIFHVDREMFAVPLAEVQEIIRMPEVVSVPLSPAALEGLANLRGSVLPVIRLRHIFGMDDIAHDDATRVVVLDQGRPVGLVVDRVANVVTVEADRIESADGIEGTVDTELLTGMIKAADGPAMVMIIDAAKVVGREFATLAGTAVGHRSASEAGGGEPGEDQTGGMAGEESQLVSFEVAGQEYALPIERVQEIVQVPAQITEMPNTPPYVLGVMTLRNRLLPLVSLRELFGLPAQALDEANKIVVVGIEGAGAGAAVGVVMDSVKEVLRVGRAVIDPVPPLLAKAGSLGEIDSICRLQDGRRLVSILAADTLFNSGALRRAAGAVTEEGGAMAREDGRGQAGVADDEEQFVAFRLMNEEFGVPIEAVQEIVRVPDELTRVPKTPDFIEGVVNLRGVVLPVVDQRRRFGLPAMERNDRQRIMVYTIRGLRTGFIVDSVSEVLRIPASAIGPAPVLSEEQQRLVRRVANIERQGRMILLLDVEQLLDGGELAAARQAAV